MADQSKTKFQVAAILVILFFLPISGFHHAVVLREGPQAPAVKDAITDSKQAESRTASERLDQMTVKQLICIFKCQNDLKLSLPTPKTTKKGENPERSLASEERLLANLLLKCSSCVAQKEQQAPQHPVSHPKNQPPKINKEKPEKVETKKNSCFNNLTKAQRQFYAQIEEFQQSKNNFQISDPKLKCRLSILISQFFANLPQETLSELHKYPEFLKHSIKFLAETLYRELYLTDRVFFDETGEQKRVTFVDNLAWDVYMKYFNFPIDEDNPLVGKIGSKQAIRKGEELETPGGLDQDSAVGEEDLSESASDFGESFGNGREGSGTFLAAGTK